MLGGSYLPLYHVHRGDGVVVEIHCQEVQSRVVPAKVIPSNPTVLFSPVAFYSPHKSQKGIQVLLQCYNEVD